MSDPREPAEEGVDLGEEEVDLGVEDENEPDEGAEPEPEEGADPPEEGEGDGEPAPRRSRGSATIKELRARAQKAEREAAEGRQRLADIERQVQHLSRQPVDPGAAQRAAVERAERRQLMSPSELAADIEQELTARFGQQFGQLQFQHADALDKAEFRASFAQYPARARYAEQVEAALQAERAAGRNHTREVVMRHLRDIDMEKRAARAAPGQRRAAAGRVAGQTVRPAGARSDSVAGRRPAPGTAAHDDATLDEARRAGRSPWE